MSTDQAGPQLSEAPPIDWPWYGIGFVPAVKRFFKKYATFVGRASRGEFWWAYLFTAVVDVVLYAIVIGGVVSAATASSGSGAAPRLGAGIYVASSLLGLFILATFIPYLAVTVRRLHDTGRSGFNVFLGFIPLVGGIILLIFLVSGTATAAEQYGPPTSQPSTQGYAASGYGQPYPGA